MTKKEVKDFTGYARHDDQVAQLTKWGIPFRLNMRGEVKVLWHDVYKSVDHMGQQPNLGDVA